MTEAQYDRFIQYQRDLTNAYINLKLDDLCERNGFPRSSWRRWKLQETVAGLKVSTKKFAAAMRGLEKAVRPPWQAE